MKCFYIILVVSLIVDVLCLNSCIQLPAQQMQNPTMDNWQGNAAEQYLQDHITQNTGTPVDWWFIVKPAGWRNFIYYDSVMEATGAQAMTFVSNYLVLNKFLLWHTLNAHKENRELLENPDFDSFKRFQTLINIKNRDPEEMAAHANVLQLHISDTLKLTPNNYVKNDIPADNRYSHAKGLFSVRLLPNAFGEAFHLQHSFIKVPSTKVKSGEEYLNMDVDAASRGQHLFCTSIPQHQVESFMRTLYTSGPNTHIANLDRKIVFARIGREKIDFVDQIVNPPFKDDCYNAWIRLLLQQNVMRNMLNNVVPDECKTPETRYNYNNINVAVIPHPPIPHQSYKLKLNEYQKKSVNPCQPVPNAPLKKINRDEERDEQVVEQTRGREIQALALGPIPWLATAYAIDTSLILSVWKHGDDLPSIEANKCLYLVEDVCYAYNNPNGNAGQKGWGHHIMHEKLGVSSDATKPWTCFGDSNHRFSEMSHAGITICIRAANLWQIMFNAVKSINTHNIVSTAAPACQVQNVGQNIVQIDNPITKWFYYLEGLPRRNNEDEDDDSRSDDSRSSSRSELFFSHHRRNNNNQRSRSASPSSDDSRSSSRSELFFSHHRNNNNQRSRSPSPSYDDDAMSE